MRKIIILLITIGLLATACDFDYLEDALDSYEEDSPDLVLTWTDENKVCTATDPDTGDIVWYETWEYDTSSKPILVQRYSPEGRLKWSKLYKWSGDLKIQEVCYDGGDKLLWHSTFSYNNEGNIVSKCNYDSGNILQWFEHYEYSGSLKTSMARYNGSSVMTDAVVWEYDGSERVIKQSRYKPASSRNSAGLEYPAAGSPPEFPAFSLSGMYVAGWTMWTYDAYGSFEMSFDSSNFPTSMSREDSRLSRTLSVDIEYYENHVPKSKRTTYGSDEVLLVELAYNGDGWLSEIDTYGKGLLMPLRYTIDYKSDKSPDRVSVYQGTTKLVYFVYDSEPRADLEVHPLDPVDFTGSVHTITQYDGSDVLLGSYEFTAEVAENQVRIQAKDAVGNPNGYFLAKMDVNGEVASFESWSKDNVLQWHYDYDYSEIAGEIMRTAEEKYDEIRDVVEDYTSIDISTFTLDLLFN